MENNDISRFVDIYPWLAISHDQEEGKQFSYCKTCYLAMGKWCIFKYVTTFYLKRHEKMMKHKISVLKLSNQINGESNDNYIKEDHPDYKIINDNDETIIKLRAPGLKKKDLSVFFHTHNPRKISISGKFINNFFKELTFKLEICLDDFVDAENGVDVEIDNGLSIIKFKKINIESTIKEIEIR